MPDKEMTDFEIARYTSTLIDLWNEYRPRWIAEFGSAAGFGTWFGAMIFDQEHAADFPPE